MMVSRTLLRSKIHRANVTSTDLNYVGSITIDEALLDAAGIQEFERVQVVDVTNGSRLETYVITGPANSGMIQLNGAAAHLMHTGDIVIIMSYAQVLEPLPADWSPRVVLLTAENRIAEVRALGHENQPARPLSTVG